MSKYTFEECDTYGIMEWAIQTYNKWLTYRPKCVDIEKLHYYIRSASMSTGTYTINLNSFNFNDLSPVSSDAEPKLIWGKLNWGGGAKIISYYLLPFAPYFLYLC